MHFAGFFPVLFTFFSCVAIVMTVRLNTPPVGGLPQYAEKWTIKCSNKKFGVFPFTLDTLLEGSSVNCSFCTQILASAKSENSHEQLLSPPGIEDLIAPVAG